YKLPPSAQGQVLYFGRRDVSVPPRGGPTRTAGALAGRRTREETQHESQIDDLDGLDAGAAAADLLVRLSEEEAGHQAVGPQRRDHHGGAADPHYRGAAAERTGDAGQDRGPAAVAGHADRQRRAAAP